MLLASEDFAVDSVRGVDVVWEGLQFLWALGSAVTRTCLFTRSVRARQGLLGRTATKAVGTD